MRFSDLCRRWGAVFYTGAVGHPASGPCAAVGAYRVSAYAVWQAGFAVGLFRCRIAALGRNVFRRPVIMDKSRFNTPNSHVRTIPIPQLPNHSALRPPRWRDNADAGNRLPDKCRFAATTGNRAAACLHRRRQLPVFP